MERNEMELRFLSLSRNEGFARAACAAFAAQMNPTVEELSDIRTAVSEAVTNAIIHGYENCTNGIIYLTCAIEGSVFRVTVQDTGCGIEDIDKARLPFFTTKPELERSGMGFAVMEAFMEEVTVQSEIGHGTVVSMTKYIRKHVAQDA